MMPVNGAEQRRHHHATDGGAHGRGGTAGSDGDDAVGAAGLGTAATPGQRDPRRPGSDSACHRYDAANAGAAAGAEYRIEQGCTGTSAEQVQGVTESPEGPGCGADQ